MFFCFKHYSIDWFKGKITGKYHISWENLWFPVDFPINQSIEWDVLLPSAYCTSKVTWKSDCTEEWGRPYSTCRLNHQQMLSLRPEKATSDLLKLKGTDQQQLLSRLAVKRHGKGRWEHVPPWLPYSDRCRALQKATLDSRDCLC